VGRGKKKNLGGKFSKKRKERGRRVSGGEKKGPLCEEGASTRLHGTGRKGARGAGNKMERERSPKKWSTPKGGPTHNAIQLLKTEYLGGPGEKKEQKGQKRSQG